jgi:hypothetical protein
MPVRPTAWRRGWRGDAVDADDRGDGAAAKLDLPHQAGDPPTEGYSDQTTEQAEHHRLDQELEQAKQESVNSFIIWVLQAS